MPNPKIGVNAPQPSGVNVIRTDYLVNKRVIIATARARRPEQFSVPKEKPTPNTHCPFCPRNQDKIILLDEQEGKKDWQFRSVRNVFGILIPEGIPPHAVEKRAGMLNESNAFGYAEVVIESPDHKKQLEERSAEEIADWISFLTKRVKALQQKPGVKYISVFKNRGRAAGASISHSHTQIITTPYIPRELAELRNAHNKYLAKAGHTPFKDIIIAEQHGKRFVYEDKHLAVITPYASETPLEIWIIPKRHFSTLTHIKDDERIAIAKALNKIFTQLYTLGTIPYNLLFINDVEYGGTQFHIRLHPRLTTDAGFEFITGLHVNTMLPEDAAAFYKKGFKRKR